VKTPQCNWR